MARSIDLGIDLGTTNSAIARQVGSRTEVIEAADGRLVPSIVRVGDDGAIEVGNAAEERRRGDPGDTVREFKRLMGTSERIVLSNGRSFLPEELSAEVLKALLARAEAGTGRRPEAAVITIPAMFQLPQCEATRRAAQLAGLAHAPLLQEPIAAAIASIGSAELRDGYWLVYDLGGGTFDISLVRSRGGRLQVLDHDGDNHLGGKDFDRALSRHMSERLRADGRFGVLRRGEAGFAEMSAGLKVEAERVRIALSSAATEQFRVTAPQGEVLEFNVGQEELEDLLRPTVSRTIRLCREMLSRNGLEPAGLRRLVLVGGPTQTPFLQRVIEDDLGIECRHYVDPSMAVVIGAAIYASTQRVPGKARPDTASGRIVAEIAYESLTNNPQPLIAGKLVGTRMPGRWQVGAIAEGAAPSGLVDVRDDSSFAFTVALAENKLNAFTLTATCDGTAVPVDQAQFVILHGTSIAKPVLSRSVGVMLADNTVRWYLRKGAILPTRQTISHSTTLALKKGQDEFAVHVPLIQGESEHGDRNTVIGEIQIKAAELSRDLPSGAEVVITLSVDEHSATAAQAFIPLLNQTFGEVARFGLETRSPEKIRDAVADQKSRLAELEKLAEGLEGTEEGDVDASVRMIDELLEDGGTDERFQADALLQRMTSVIDGLVSKDAETNLRQKFAQSEAQSRALLPQADKKRSRELTALASEFADAMARSDFSLAEVKLKAARDIEWGLIQELPSYWAQLFDCLCKTVLTQPNAAEGRIAIEAGKSAILRNDLNGLVQACLALLRLLPETDVPAVIRSHVA